MPGMGGGKRIDFLEKGDNKIKETCQRSEEPVMKVVVKLFANFREYLPAGSEKYSCTLELEEGTTVGQVLERLKIPESVPLIPLVNGIHGKTEDPLQPGDVLSVFPPVAGG